MVKNTITNFLRKFGYDIIKTENFNFGKRTKRQSDIATLDYFETPIGNYYLPKNLKSDVVANRIKEGKVFDQHIIDIAFSYVKKNSIVLDIGANYGQMSVILSKQIDASCAIYAFEAQEMVFKILEKNVAKNQAENVKLFFNAVYDKNNVELIFPEPDLVRFSTYGSYGLDPNAKSGKTVESITIDSINFNKSVSFMKVDIQGSDLFALRGAVNTIDKYKMPIIFEYEEQFQKEFKTSFQDYVDFVESINYKFLETVDDINFLIVPK